MDTFYWQIVRTVFVLYRPIIDGGEKVNMARLIMNQFRWLDRIVNCKVRRLYLNEPMYTNPDIRGQKVVKKGPVYVGPSNVDAENHNGSM